MARLVVRRTLFVAALSCVFGLSGAVASLSADVSKEIQRGFAAAGKCFRGSVPASRWHGDFQKLLSENAAAHRDSDGFLAGANFGFSYRIESNGEGISAMQAELHQLAAWAALARVAFEDKKKSLGLSDAELIQLLAISKGKFAHWKARVSTRDTDQSILKKQPGVDL
ncbi:MAG: hypothetical protein ABJB09_06855 [Verrucomicrobiota bacterium]